MSTARTASASALLLAGLALAPGCGSSSSDGPVDGAQLFVSYTCSQCHRHEGQGGPLGPPLRGLSERWAREDLARYLRDPKSFVDKDGRLQALARNYNMQMPGIRIDDERLAKLLDYVLSL